MDFTKMEGLGNDYVFVDLTRGTVPDRDWPAVSREISCRHFGIGSDGLILIMPPRSGGDFRMRMFNADGSEGEMCGNGIRCFARYVYERGLSGKTVMNVETPAGIIRPEVLLEDGDVAGVRVDMGPPRFLAKEIPCGFEDAREGPPRGYLDLEGERYEVFAVSTGNPHAVIIVEELDGISLAEIGPLIENHHAFPARTNVEFVKVESGDSIRARIWERGSGITLACGTGACAAAVVCASRGLTSRSVQVALPGGSLTVEWVKKGSIFMTGPANEVFQGSYTRWTKTRGCKD